MSNEVVDKDPCVVCGIIVVDRAHIRSKGSGGGNEDWNLMWLCRRHHQEQHKIGWYKMCQKYDNIDRALTEKNWTFENEFGVEKLRRLD